MQSAAESVWGSAIELALGEARLGPVAVVDEASRVFLPLPPFVAPKEFGDQQAFSGPGHLWHPWTSENRKNQVGIEDVGGRRWGAPTSFRCQARKTDIEMRRRLEIRPLGYGGER